MEQEISGGKISLATKAVIAVVLVAAVAGLAWIFAGNKVTAPVATITDELLPPVSQELIVGMSFDTLGLARWRKERDIITAEIEKEGGTVLVASADGDADLQVSQAKNLILQGAKVLIVVAADGEKAAAIVDAAHESGVKVIAYDRLIKNSNLDYYISFDNVKVGESQAKVVLQAIGNKGKIAYIGGSPTDNNAFLVRDGSFSVIKPLVDAGAVEVVFDRQIDGWDTDKAYEAMNGFLKDGGVLDGAVVANDGMASGVIQALLEHGLAGKVPVSGQDAELRACRDLLTGYQTVTVYKPLHELALEAVRMSLAIVGGQPVITDQMVNNGQVNVPSRLLGVVAVTASNLKETVIADGLYLEDEVYGNN